jgi:hypothetical protein
MSLRRRFSNLPLRRRKQLFWTVGLITVYTLAGFFLVPAIIKWQLLKQLPDITKRQVEVRQVKFNPYALSLTIRDLSLKEPTGAPFASFEEFYINFQTSSLFRWAWTFKEIRLVRPFGEVILLKNGQLNFANMFPAEKEPSPEPKPRKAAGIPRINIFHLQLTNGFLTVQDQTRRSTFRTEYRPINFVLTDFSTRPESDTPYTFRAESDAGRSLAWKGNFSVQPLRSNGDLEILGIRLSHYQPYLEDFTTAHLTNGVMDMRLSYRFGADTNGFDMVLTNGAFTLSKLDIRDPETSEMVAGLEKFSLTGAEMNLRQRTARVREVAVTDASLLGRLKNDGKVNLLSLLVPSEKPKSEATNVPPAEPWTVALDHIFLTNAAVVFEDLSRQTPFRTEIKPISFDLRDLSTAAETHGTYRFNLATESAETLSGEGTVSVTPVTSNGEVNLAGLQLTKYMPYAETAFAGKLTSGKLDIQIPYRFALTTNGIRAGVSNLAVTLSDLEIKTPEKNETVARIERADVKNVDASLEHTRAAVGFVNLAGGSILLRQAKDGTINLLGLLKQSPEPPKNSPSPEPAADHATNKQSTNAPKWSVSLNEFNLANYTIQIEDEKPARPVMLKLNDFGLNIRNASTDLTAPIAAKLNFTLAEKGIVDLAADVRLDPVSANANLGITNIDLRTIQPYLDERVGLTITSGLLSTYGKAAYTTNSSSFSGDVMVAEFSCTDTLVKKPFASWGNLFIGGIAAELPVGRTGNVKIEQVRWTNPKATLVLSPEGKPNLPQMVGTTQSGTPLPTPEAPVQPDSASEAAPVAAADSDGEPFPMEIGTVTLEKASLGFSDLSIQPNATIAIEQLTGTIKGLSSAMNTTADVDLTGFVGEHSPFAIVGRVNPLASQMFMDITISNANTQLTPLTGYMEKFAGYPLNRGRLSTSLHYLVKGEELKAENQIQIDQLTLGARNNSPDATSLPVKLGIALLKDANGRIELDVPLSGRLNDPQFKVGPIILKIVLNTLVKAAASPFKLLGALVGGGEELSFVQFTPGTSEATPEEAAKLEKLKKALEARPALNVDIEGQVDLSSDRKALSLAKLRDQIRTSKLEQLTKQGKKVESPDNFQLEPEEYQRVLRTMFVEQFGTNIAAVLQSNLVAQAAEEAKAAERKPAQKLGVVPIIKRTYRTALSMVGLGPLRKSPAEKRLTREEREMLGRATPEMMEQLLAETAVTVSPEEYRTLMAARAQWVQNWLLQKGGLAADRVLLVAPKTVGEDYQGSSRATLSLN